MENIKDNSNEPVELKNEELEKVAGGFDLPFEKKNRYKCKNIDCGKTFEASGALICPYCHSPNIKRI